MEYGDTMNKNSLDSKFLKKKLRKCLCNKKHEDILNGKEDSGSCYVFLIACNCSLHYHTKRKKCPYSWL